MAQEGKGFDYLVTLGETIKFWDLTSLAIQHAILPTKPSTSIKCFDFNKTNDNVVSVPSFGKSLIFTECNSSGPKDVEIQLKIDAKVTCAKYAKSHLLLGSSCGQLIYYNLDSLKTIKQFTGHNSEITNISVNADYSHFASGAMNGAIWIHNLTSSVGSKLTKTSTRDSTVRSLCYNPQSNSLLVSACDNGNITLWNVNKSKILTTFNGIHKAPAMDFSFSSFNPHLGASVGIDRKVIIYDVRIRKCLKEFSADEPLRSVTFDSKGTNVLVGSSKGHIFFYDLRQSNNCVNVFKAHSSAVGKIISTEITPELHAEWTKSSFSSEITSPVASNLDIDFYGIISPVQNTFDHENTENSIPITNVNLSTLTSFNCSESFSTPPITTKQTYATKVTPKILKPLNPVELFSNQDAVSKQVSGFDNVETNLMITEEVSPLKRKCDHLKYGTKCENQLNVDPTEKETVKMPTEATINNQQLDDLKEHMNDVISDLKYSFHSEYMLLLTKMVKFHVELQEEVKCLRQECNHNEDLIEENIRLREENIRLRSAF